MENKKTRKWGQRTIKLTIHFFTNNLPKGTDQKTAWASGVIQIKSNKSIGLPEPSAPKQMIFNSAEDLLPRMEELLDKNGVKLIKMPETGYTTVSLSKVRTKETHVPKAT